MTPHIPTPTKGGPAGPAPCTTWRPVAPLLALALLGILPHARAAVPAGVILPDGITVEADLLEHEVEPGKHERIAWQGRVRVGDGRVQLLAEQLRFDAEHVRFLGQRLQVQALAADDAAAAPAMLTLSCDAGGALVGGDASPSTTLAGWRFDCIEGDVAATPPSPAHAPRG